MRYDQAVAQQRATSSGRPPGKRPAGPPPDRSSSSGTSSGSLQTGRARSGDRPEGRPSAANGRPPSGRNGAWRDAGPRRAKPKAPSLGDRVRRSTAKARAWEADRKLVRRYGLVAMVSILVLLPVFTAVFRHSVGGWVPDGDDAWVARRTMQVVSTSPPLIGQESTASDEPTESGLNHPGPVSYYVMAVPYAASGWSPIGLIVGAGFIVGVAMVCAVAMGWCVLQERGALGVGIALALISVRLGQEWLVRPTSSALVAIPLGAGLLGLWAYLRGSRSGFFVALGLGTFAMQTSLVVLPMAGALVLATLVVVVVKFVRTRELPVHGWSWLFIAAVAAVWIPPLIDQFTRQPGNLADLLHYLYSDASGNKRTGKVTEALGIGPSAATVLDGVANPFGIDDRRIRGASVWLVTPQTLGLVAPLIFAACTAVALWWSATRRRTAILALFAVAAGASALAIFAFARRPTETLFNSTYFVLWIQGVGLLWWSAIGIAAVDAGIQWARDRRGRPPAGTAAAAREHRRMLVVQRSALVVTGLLALAASWTVVPDQEAQRVRGLSAQVRQNLPPGTYEVEGKGFVAWLSTAKGLGTDLIAHGYDARFTEWGGMVDEQQRRATSRTPQVFVVAQERGAATEVPDDPTILGTYRDDDVQLIAIYVPGGDFARLCEQVTGFRAGINGQVIEAGDIGTTSSVGAVLEQLSLKEIAKDRDPAVRQAAKDLDGQRDQLVAQLDAVAEGELAIDQVDPALVASLKTLIDAYATNCAVAPPVSDS